MKYLDIAMCLSLLKQFLSVKLLCVCDLAKIIYNQYKLVDKFYRNIKQKKRLRKASFFVDH